MKAFITDGDQRPALAITRSRGRHGINAPLALPIRRRIANRKPSNGSCAISSLANASTSSCPSRR
jgi:hypothetical protein